MPQHVLILGAGLTGIGAAKALGTQATLVEKNDTPGGVARSFHRDGFTFDITGHWLHLRDDGVRTWAMSLLGDELVEIQRRAAVFSHGVLTPYPFQANTHGLPTDVVAECLLGYFEAREKTAAGAFEPAASFYDFILQRMGKGIADHFMVPYNQKLWTVHPNELAHDWCERFVPTPDPESVVRGALSTEGASHRLGYNASFLYPKAGGIARLSQALFDDLDTRAEFGREAVAVDLERRTVSFADGADAAFDVLVSTIPLPRLVAITRDVPHSVKHACSKLRATDVTYWDVGFRGANGDAPQWIYFPETHFPFYRVGSPSAAWPQTAPAGHRSYYVEAATPSGQPCTITDDAMLQGLRTAGLVGTSEEPVTLTRCVAKQAYVIMDHAYGAARQEVLQWFEGQGVHSIGRYGGWMYDSMEGALLQGLKLGRRLANEI